MELALEIKQLTVQYDAVKALDQVNLSIAKHTTLGLVGESGSGKSTLARVIMGLIIPQEGAVIIEDEEMKRKRTRSQYKKIQMIFQNPDSSLNPKHSIRQILSEALLFHHIVDRSQVEKRCKELMKQVRLDPNTLGRYPHEFSGGQRQRIAIARALSVEPSILIADEPTSALDVSVQRNVLDLFSELKRELNLTMLFISHDLGVIHAVSDQIAVMKQGKVVEVNQNGAFFSNPSTAYSRELLSSIPKMPQSTQLGGA